MPTLRKISLTLFSANLVLLTAIAQGAYNGDIDYSNIQISPTNRGGACLGTYCPPLTTYATQNYDCNLGGYGTPRPPADPYPNVNWGDLAAMSADFFFDEDPTVADFNDDGMVNLSDLVLIEHSFGQAPGTGTIPSGGIATPLGSAVSGAGAARAAANRGDADDQRIMITGSRISKPELQQTSPVQVVGDSSKSGLNGYSPDPYQIKAFPSSGLFGGDRFPAMGLNYADYGADADPWGFTGPSGAQYDTEFRRPAAYEFSPLPAGTVNLEDWDSLNFEYPGDYKPTFDEDGLDQLSIEELISLDVTSVAGGRSTQNFGGQSFGTLQFNPAVRSQVEQELRVIGVIIIETDWCRIVLVPTDPSYTRTGRHDGNSWGARLDDQWAIKRVGFTDDEDSAWNQVPDTASDVVVAVIDTGLDWHHLDISPQSIWRNPNEIPDNNIDDDNNGYVDDVIGWNFMGRNNKPWDYDGHGTVVAGIIAAAQNNNAGIAGINPHAKIMVLKGVNNFGTTRASFLAEAIKYAADNGAKIINISVGGPHETEIEKAAIAYAHSKGVLIIAASGNEGIELDDFGPGGNDHVLTVGATHTDDRVGGFSNFGEDIDLVAPGVDVLSLRARFTDVNYRPASGEEYEIGTNYVGEDKRYIHVSGTSFSTPIVTGVASLLLAKHPQLSAEEVERLLIETAEDVETPGKDKYAGYGMVDARAALSVEPDFFITAEISGLEFVQTDEKDQIHVKGSIGAGAFKRAWVQIGAGENPAVWKAVGQKRKLPIENGTISSIDLSEFAGSELWQVLVNVEHRNGVVKKVVRPLRIK